MQKSLSILASILVPLALLTACNSQSTTPSLDTDASSSETMQKPMAGGVEERIVDVTVKNWAFSPSTITLKKDENVIIRLKGLEGSHGFMVEGLEMNVRVSAGETTDVTVPTDRPGTYAFRCSIPCGSGHRDMTGTIVIE